MKNVISILFWILNTTLLFGQSFLKEESKLIWDVNKYNEKRLDFKVVTVGEIANSGTESFSLRVANLTGHDLYFEGNLSVNLVNGGSKSYTIKKRVDAGQIIGRNPFNDGYDLMLKGDKKSYGPDANGNDFRTFISSVFFELNIIRDLTNEATSKANTEQENVIANSNYNTGASYYSNNESYSANNNISTTSNKITWEETNARIKAEYQQIYLNTQANIPAQQWVNQVNSDQLASEATELVGMIGGLFEQARKDKEKKELYRQEQAEQQRLAQIRESQRLAAIKKEKLYRQELRNAFILEFPDGGIPLTSDKVGVNLLYFFSYSYDSGTVTNELPFILYTNIYKIFKYNDGTWPYKAVISDELKTLGFNGTINQIGYFTTSDLAEQMRDDFIDKAAKSSIALQEVQYKGKESNKTQLTDFWETGTVIKSNLVKDSTTKKDPVKDNFWDN